MSKKDDFVDDDWGPSSPTGGTGTDFDTMPESTVDPNRPVWLKPVHVGGAGAMGKLELVSASGSTQYSDVTLHVKTSDGKQFALGLRTWDPAFQALRKKFGPKRADWHGSLKFKVMPHNGKPDGFVAVRPA